VKKSANIPLHLPILVEAQDDEKVDGHLFSGSGFTSVHRVSPSEIVEEIEKFRGEDEKLWSAVESLRTAYRRMDIPGIKEATEPLRPRIFWGTTRDQPHDGTRGTAWADYSGLVNDALEGARFRTWWHPAAEHLLNPAVFCPDWKTAAFAMLFSGRVRLCPHCNAPFVPETVKHEFCCKEHGAAYRTQQSRKPK
jgi:hypothetical protein